MCHGMVRGFGPGWGPLSRARLRPRLRFGFTFRLALGLVLEFDSLLMTDIREHKPADVLVPASATGTDKATALDITITDPTNKTALDRGSDRNPLVAAAVRHTVKLGSHKNALEEAGDQGLPFTKGPLVFETTGAMEEETQKWWKSIVEMEADQRIPGAPQSRREQGLEHTWSANKFSSCWIQKNSMSHARMQAESIAQWIGTCRKA